MSDEQIEPVFEVDEAVFYEWTHFAVFRHPNYPDMFTTAWGGGCSCNSWEPPTVQELRAGEPVNRPGVRRAFIGFMDGNSSWFSPGAAVRYLEEFEIAMNVAEQA